MLAWRRKRHSRALAAVGGRSRILKVIRRDRPVEPRHRDPAPRTAQHTVHRDLWPIWPFELVSACYAAAAVFNSGFGRIMGTVAASGFLCLASDFGWTFTRARGCLRGTGPTSAG